MTEDDKEKIVKIQAMHRGKLARKEATKMTPVDSNAPPAEAESPDATPAPADAPAEEFTAEDEEKIAKLQAMARGNAARQKLKEENEKKPAGTEAATDEPETAAKEENDVLPAVESFTDDDKSRIVKIQAMARGKHGRNLAAEKAAAVATTPVEAEAEATTPTEEAAGEEAPAVEKAATA